MPAFKSSTLEAEAEFKASLIYGVCLRAARATQGKLCLEKTKPTNQTNRTVSDPWDKLNQNLGE